MPIQVVVQEYVNRAENDGDNLFAGCTHSELVLMEVAA